MLLWTAFIAIALDVALKLADYNFLALDQINATQSPLESKTNNGLSKNNTYNDRRSGVGTEITVAHHLHPREEEVDEVPSTRVKRSLHSQSVNPRRGIFRIQNDEARVFLTMTIKQEICICVCGDGFPPNWEKFETFGSTSEIFKRSLTANLNLTRITFKTQLWKIHPVESWPLQIFTLQPVASLDIFTDSQNLVDFKGANGNGRDWLVENDEDEYPDVNLQSSFIPFNRSWVVKPASENNKYSWKISRVLHYEIHTHIPGKCVNINGEGYIGNCGESASSWILVEQ